MELAAILKSLSLTLQHEDVHSSTFSGHAEDGPAGRVYGGQVMAQAMSACQATVQGEYQLHSMHCYFLRPGDTKRPLEYKVNKLRDGRSVCSRAVTAIQNGNDIFTALASFQRPEQGLEFSAIMPIAPPPESLQPDKERIQQWFKEQNIPDTYGWPIDVRFVEAIDFNKPSPKPARDLVWVKASGPLPSKPHTHLQMLAYASDNPITAPAFNPHGTTPFLNEYFGTTLNHTLWIHRPINFSEWLLFEIDCDITHGARGLVRAKIFDQSGDLVASANQECLMRKTRK